MVNTAIRLLEHDINKPFDSFGEAISYSLSKSLFGLLMVFGILALLWGFLVLFKIAFYTIPNKRKAKSEKIKDEKTAPVKADSAMETVPSAPSNEGEIVAAITAAISAFRGASGESVGGFRVVSFKKRK